MADMNFLDYSKIRINNGYFSSSARERDIHLFKYISHFGKIAIFPFFI